MSRTHKGAKAPGYEYWASRLHRHGETPGRLTKRWTHGKERREAKAKLDKFCRELTIELTGIDVYAREGLV